jgi:hypothetical protein
MHERVRFVAWLPDGDFIVCGWICLHGKKINIFVDPRPQDTR